MSSHRLADRSQRQAPGLLHELAFVSGFALDEGEALDKRCVAGVLVGRAASIGFR